MVFIFFTELFHPQMKKWIWTYSAKLKKFDKSSPVCISPMEYYPIKKRDRFLTQSFRITSEDFE